jgi:hypothetical protein
MALWGFLITLMGILLMALAFRKSLSFKDFGQYEVRAFFASIVFFIVGIITLIRA